MAQIEINGRQITVADGSTIMDAAEAAGIYIPRFCYHKKLSIAASCRMCLVEVEKSPKPVPACATPVSDGMKVSTHSAKAVEAQKIVMEFLLVNHPLDCPICDQGGECMLQDIAVGYGGSASRYAEEKRVVVNKDFGPLVAGDMTRCIQCTRCVRFGQEIAGQMELGMIHRGEHSEITTFLQRHIGSELSGNVIDLCPVGALTSKPFRYQARGWELVRRAGVSPHDGLGANLSLHVKPGKPSRVLRVVPRDNEALNECWLADRDRFSYQGLYAEDRLVRPMVKYDGAWREVEWSEALRYVADGLRQVKGEFGAENLAALASPHATLEELFLLQKLLRAQGSDNVDCRPRQSDFRADGKRAGAPWLGMPVAELDTLERILLVGSRIRAEQPLIAQRLRQAVKHGAQLNVVHAADDDLLCRVANRLIAAPGALVNALAQIARALSEALGSPLPPEAAGAAHAEVGDAARAIAASLASGEKKAVLLGAVAQHHPRYAEIHALSQAIADLAGARLGVLAEAANSVGGHLANALPHGGLNARAMFAAPRKAYLLLGVEVEADTYDPALALAALSGAFVVALTSFKGRAQEHADVLLPIAPFAETAGSFVNMQGDVQSFGAATPPLGESRPAWKVLRVLGNLLDLPGFDYEDVADVRAEAVAGGLALDNRQNGVAVTEVTVEPGLWRLGEVPLYGLDALTRRASALQQTAAAPRAWMHGTLMNEMGIGEGETVVLRQGAGEARIEAARDDRLAPGTVRVDSAPGGLLHPIEVEKAR